VQPYSAGFRAIDVPTPPTPSLVDLKGTNIRVIAPGPDTLFATPNGSAIELTWPRPLCPNVHHFNIYRRTGPFPGTIDCPCTNGVPSSTGYELVATVLGTDTTFFVDDNKGQGLTIGIQYCYRVTAVYLDPVSSDESESCASPEACASLKKDAPVITNADVTTTSTTNGAVYVAWSKPTEIDTLAFQGPYEYRIYHSGDFFGTNFSQVFTYSAPMFYLLNDTIYTDTLIDTQTSPWSYRIELYYTDTITHQLTYKGRTATASTVFLSIAPTDNRLNLSWEEHVPWTNSSYNIYKQNSSLTFDSIANVTTQSYSDTGLINGQQYCYLVRSTGSYAFSGFIDPILNKSQIVCAIPVDNVPPCSPELSVIPDCNANLNGLTWTNPNHSCADDVLKYYIYFGSEETGNYELIDSTLSPNDTTYQHTGLAQISGCHKVTAIDSVGNETVAPQIVCVDTCRQ